MAFNFGRGGRGRGTGANTIPISNQRNTGLQHDSTTSTGKGMVWGAGFAPPKETSGTESGKGMVWGAGFAPPKETSGTESVASASPFAKSGQQQDSTASTGKGLAWGAGFGPPKETSGTESGKGIVWGAGFAPPKETSGTESVASASPFAKRQQQDSTASTGKGLAWGAGFGPPKETSGTESGKGLAWGAGFGPPKETSGTESGKGLAWGAGFGPPKETSGTESGKGIVWGAGFGPPKETSGVASLFAKSGGFDKNIVSNDENSPGESSANVVAEGEGGVIREEKDITYVPVTRSVEELFKEDTDNAELYRNVVSEDETIFISGGRNVEAKIDKWEEANLHPALLENIRKAHYYRARPIQTFVIPLVLEGCDVQGHAETGSGKTAAFVIPIIQKLLDMGDQPRSTKPQPSAIIVLPTRELCLQVYEQAQKLAYGTKIRVCKAIGKYMVGVNIGELNVGCDILCTTTGRLMHFITHTIVDPSKLKFLVLDEADRLLEQGTFDMVEKAITYPGFPSIENRQTLLFSATYPTDVQNWASKVMKADSIFVSNQKKLSTNHRVEQKFIQVFNSKSKAEDLVLLLNEEINSKKKKGENPELRRTLVFVQTKRNADRIALFLCGKGFLCTNITGDRSQALRDKALRDFREGKFRILVSTDVCARGIDIKDLDHVINVDLPHEAVTYIHRVGRTGRITAGHATSFYDEATDKPLVDDLINILQTTNQEVPPFFTDQPENWGGTGWNTNKQTGEQKAGWNSGTVDSGWNTNKPDEQKAGWNSEGNKWNTNKENEQKPGWNSGTVGSGWNTNKQTGEQKTGWNSEGNTWNTNKENEQKTGWNSGTVEGMVAGGSSNNEKQTVDWNPGAVKFGGQDSNKQTGGGWNSEAATKGDDWENNKQTGGW